MGSQYQSGGFQDIERTKKQDQAFLQTPTGDRIGINLLMSPHGMTTLR